MTTTRDPITARGAAQPTVGWAPWRRALWYHAAFWARTWRGQVFSSFLFPILYLAAMGLGVGKLVDAHAGTVQGVPYLDFVAPALLAMAAMQISANESMWPVLASFKWTRSYWTAVATPITPRDLVARSSPGWPCTWRWSVSPTPRSSRPSGSSTARSRCCCRSPRR